MRYEQIKDQSFPSSIWASSPRIKLEWGKALSWDPLGSCCSCTTSSAPAQCCKWIKDTEIWVSTSDMNTWLNNGQWRTNAHFTKDSYNGRTCEKIPLEARSLVKDVNRRGNYFLHLHDHKEVAPTNVNKESHLPRDLQQKKTMRDCMKTERPNENNYYRDCDSYY